LKGRSVKIFKKEGKKASISMFYPKEKEVGGRMNGENGEPYRRGVSGHTGHGPSGGSTEKEVSLCRTVPQSNKYGKLIAVPKTREGELI